MDYAKRIDELDYELRTMLQALNGDNPVKPETDMYKANQAACKNATEMIEKLNSQRRFDEELEMKKSEAERKANEILKDQELKERELDLKEKELNVKCFELEAQIEENKMKAQNDKFKIIADCAKEAGKAIVVIGTVCIIVKFEKDGFVFTSKPLGTVISNALKFH